MKALPPFKRVLLAGLLAGGFIGWHAWHLPSVNPDDAGDVSVIATARLPVTPVPVRETLSPLIQGIGESLAALQAEANPMAQSQEIQAYVRSVDLGEIASVLGVLQGLEATGSSQTLQILLVRRWAEDDPLAAAAWAQGLPAGAVRQDMLGGVAIVWANQDAIAAAGWACQLAEGVERQDALTSVAYEVARTKPVDALQLAVDLPAGARRDDLIHHAALQWSAQDSQASLEWALKIEDASVRDRVLADIATTWGESDPVAAAALAVQSIPAGKLQDDAVMGIVQRWVQQDPGQTAAWVEQFPAGQLQHDAVDNVVRLWGVRGWDAPAQWLGHLPSGSLRDAGLETLVQGVAPLNRAMAVAWSNEIGDETIRARVLVAIDAR